jgi:hypothetical protein
MDITVQTFDQLARNFRADFQSGQDFQPGVDLGFLCQDYPSSGNSNVYPWLDTNYRGWREWVGARAAKTLEAKGYELRNKIWEDTVQVPLSAIEDDNDGNLKIYSQRVGGMKAGWQEKRYQWGLLGMMENVPCFTGKPFFAADHLYGDGNVIANMVANAFSKATFEAAMALAGGWKFADKIPCRSLFTHCVFGPTMYATVFGVLGAQRLNGQEDNPNYGRCKMVQTDLLTGDYANLVLLVDGAKSIKPGLRQVRKDGDVLVDTNPATAVRNGYLDALGYARGAYGVTFPHLAFAFMPAAEAPAGAAEPKGKGKGKE